MAWPLSHQRIFCQSRQNVWDTEAIFAELDIDIDPKVKVATLSVSQMQMLEIAKAFSYDAKVVIMDEPTSSLTEKEVNHLFTIIKKLKEKGCGVVYISHKMEEILSICDEITILRDGQWVDTRPLKGLDMDKIISMMVGRELTQRFPEKSNEPKNVILEVKNLTALNQPSIQDISFELRAGKFWAWRVSSVRAVPTLWRPFLVCVNAVPDIFCSMVVK